MKKTVICLMLIVTACLVSCRDEKWDTDKELYELTISWSNEFVNDLLSESSIKYVDTVYASTNKTVSTSLKDSLFIMVHTAFNNQPDKDSVDVISELTQIRDSVVVKVDGYRYSQKYWVHLFTVDPGIINYEGKFHVDFYEIGKTTPWAWSEITYHRNKYAYYAYQTDPPVVHWY